MIRNQFSIWTFFFLFMVAFSCRGPETGEAVDQQASGREYLGQSLPGSTPELFGPGLISTHRNERDFALSPDGKLLFYSYALPGFSRSTILTLRYDDKTWSQPEVAWFSGEFNDLEPAFSPDGNSLFFISRRPLSDNDSTDDWNIWVIKREKGDWGMPRALDTVVNKEGNEYYPSVAGNGNLYFTVEKGSDSFGGEDIYCSVFRDGKYLAPHNLGEGVNGPRGEFNAFIAPDERYLIFSSWGRPDGFGGGDLYIAFRDDSGKWGQAVNMGGTINSDKLDYCPFVTAGGSLLVFTSQRVSTGITERSRHDLSVLRSLEDGPGNGLGDIYWVAFDADKWE